MMVAKTPKKPIKKTKKKAVKKTTAKNTVTSDHLNYDRFTQIEQQIDPYPQYKRPNTATIFWRSFLVLILMVMLLWFFFILYTYKEPTSLDLLTNPSTTINKLTDTYQHTGPLLRFSPDVMNKTGNNKIVVHPEWNKTQIKPTFSPKR